MRYNYMERAGDEFERTANVIAGEGVQQDRK